MKIEFEINIDDSKQVKALNSFIQAMLKIKAVPTKKAAPEGIKIEDIRALLAKKVTAHRADIKAELTRLGANNVTSLDPERYQEFMDFLNGLK